MNSAPQFLNQYSQLPKKGGWRPILRARALDLLSRLTPSFSPGPIVQLVYLHHLFEDEKTPFRRLLSRLSEKYTFISHSEAVQRILSQQIDRPYLSFSWDDGFKNCLNAVDILNEFDAKGCFFICPELIGFKEFQKIKTFNNKQLNFPPVEYMDWNEIELLLKSGHEIGSHTLRHINIAHTEKTIVEDEIFQSAQIIKERTGKIGHFAWPYGTFSDFSPQAKKMVFEAGFESCASAVRGAHPPIDVAIKREDLCLRRDHIVAAWPLRHNLYFVKQSSRITSAAGQYWPEAYRN